MSGELTKLSETRWRYATSRRVFYIRQVKAPNEDLQEPGLYRVDGGAGSVCLMSAESIEQLVEVARQSQSPTAKSDPAS